MTTTHLDTDPVHVDDASFTRALQRSAALEHELQIRPETHIVLSGDRPTGDLHLGHLLGTLANRIRLLREVMPAARTLR